MSSLGPGFLAPGASRPQAWLEFDVDNVEKATPQLESQGHRILAKIKKEPWGQTVSRFMAPERLLVGVAIISSMREEEERSAITEAESSGDVPVRHDSRFRV